MNIDRRVIKQTKHTPWILVLKRFIPTELLPLPAKIGPTFPGRRCCVVRTTDPYGRSSRFYTTVTLIFLSSSSSVILTRLRGPRYRPITSQKIWYCR
jgi:hypothetical protein